MVEDDCRVRAMAADCLRARGYDVVEAADGAEALERLDADPVPVDLVLTDVVMPRMGGMELCEAARAAAPDLRFLFSSGYAEDTVHVGFVKKEGIFFLAKPYGIDALARKVREALDTPSTAPPPPAP